MPNTAAAVSSAAAKENGFCSRRGTAIWSADRLSGSTTQVYDQGSDSDSNMSCSCEDHKLSAIVQVEKSALQAAFDTDIAVFFRRKGSLQYHYRGFVSTEPAKSLIEDGLGPGNEVELSDHSLSSARPQQDRLTKTDKDDNAHDSSNQFTNFVAAYVARLDAEDSVYQIKKSSQVKF